MKGAVLVIGSLLWEDETNSLNKEQGKLRSDWRKYLDIQNKVPVKVPIRYGRKSSSRRCTYTMIFSNSQTELGIGFLIPFKANTSSFEDVKEQALKLSEAEGILTKESSDRLTASWGTVGIVFNNKTKENLENIKDNWHKEFQFFNNDSYKLGEESPSIKENGELNFSFDIPQDIDYVFATPVKPNISEYPTTDKIIKSL